MKFPLEGAGKGDKSRVKSSKNYRNNYDKIFGKDEKCQLNHQHDEECKGYEHLKKGLEVIQNKDSQITKANKLIEELEKDLQSLEKEITKDINLIGDSAEFAESYKKVIRKSLKKARKFRGVNNG